MINKRYQVEISLSKGTWTLIESMTRHKEALEYVRGSLGERYPVRIVRVTRAIVFQDNKDEKSVPKSKRTRLLKSINRGLHSSSIQKEKDTATISVTQEKSNCTEGKNTKKRTHNYRRGSTQGQGI